MSTTFVEQCDRCGRTTPKADEEGLPDGWTFVDAGSKNFEGALCSSCLASFSKWLTWSTRSHQSRIPSSDRASTRILDALSRENLSAAALAAKLSIDRTSVNNALQVLARSKYGSHVGKAGGKIWAITDVGRAQLRVRTDRGAKGGE